MSLELAEIRPTPGESAEQVAVRPKAYQLQDVVGLPVDQQEVGFDVAFPVVDPVAGQPMVALLRRQRGVLGQ